MLERLDRLAEALRDLEFARLSEWAQELVTTVVRGGGRLLVAGNGGSAAQAQHLTAELVGRFRRERAPLSALALHADSSSVTGIGNDYGFEEVFARPVRAHGRDILLPMSTSGTSANLRRAADAANQAGLRTWALTGPAPNLLSERCSSTLCVDAGSPATVQERHLVAIHVLCDLLESNAV